MKDALASLVKGVASSLTKSVLAPGKVYTLRVEVLADGSLKVSKIQEG